MVGLRRRRGRRRGRQPGRDARPPRSRARCAGAPGPVRRGARPRPARHDPRYAGRAATASRRGRGPLRPARRRGAGHRRRRSSSALRADRQLGSVLSTISRRHGGARRRTYERGRGGRGRRGTRPSQRPASPRPTSRRPARAAGSRTRPCSAAASPARRPRGLAVRGRRRGSRRCAGSCWSTTAPVRSLLDIDAASSSSTGSCCDHTNVRGADDRRAPRGFARTEGGAGRRRRRRQRRLRPRRRGRRLLPPGRPARPDPAARVDVGGQPSSPSTVRYCASTGGLVPATPTRSGTAPRCSTARGTPAPTTWSATR